MYRFLVFDRGLGRSRFLTMDALGKGKSLKLVLVLGTMGPKTCMFRGFYGK